MNILGDCHAAPRGEPERRSVIAGSHRAPCTAATAGAVAPASEAIQCSRSRDLRPASVSARRAPLPRV